MPVVEDATELAPTIDVRGRVAERTTTGHPTRNVGIDLLRFIAVLLTLIRHMTPYPPESLPTFVRVPLRVLVQGAWTGVDMFFVLSGFLVSGLLFSEFRERGQVSFTRFFIRRGLRIYPAFFVLLFGYGLMEHLTTRLLTPQKFLHEALFVQNYLPGMWNHTWSLAVEEHFYLLIGLSLALLANRKRSMAAAPWLFGGVMLLCLGLRFIYVDRANVMAESHFRFDALAFGALIAWFRYFAPGLLGWTARWRVRLFCTGIVLIAPCYMVSMPGWQTLTWGLTASYLGYGLIMISVALSGELALPGKRLFASLGAHSYSTYLWHMAVKRAFSIVRRRGLFDWPYLVELLLYTVTSFAFGWLMSRAVEFPALRMRDKLFPSLSKSTPRSAELATKA